MLNSDYLIADQSQREKLNTAHLIETYSACASKFIVQSRAIFLAHPSLPNKSYSTTAVVKTLSFKAIYNTGSHTDNCVLNNNLRNEEKLII